MTRALHIASAILATLPLAAVGAAAPAPPPPTAPVEATVAAPAPPPSPLPAPGAPDPAAATAPAPVARATALPASTTPAGTAPVAVTAPVATVPTATAPAAPAATAPVSTAPAAVPLSAPAATRKPSAARPRPPAAGIRRRVLFTITGAGFGHGVGMSQYGAYGAALAGWDAERILRFYYRGVDITQAGGTQVRVLLTLRRPGAPVPLTSTGPWAAVPEGPVPGPPIPLAAGVDYAARVEDGAVVLRGPDGADIGSFPVGVVLRPAAEGDPGQQIRIGARPYRGAIRLVPSGGLLAINLVDLEQYLGGVVAQEMPASWGDRAPAALRAQAIAARTYSLASLRPTQPYDMYDDTRSQVYGGVAAEDPRAVAAVTATAGRVITFGGNLITAFYFSTSGGHTEDGGNVFPSTTPMPYLVGVPDPFDGLSPLHRWKPRTITGSRLGRVLRMGAPVAQLKVLRRGSSPRVMSALVVSSTGARATLTGADVRRLLKLPDTWFSVRRTLIRVR